jgi:hypothetical protein
MSKKEHNQMDDTVPVFQIKPINTTSIVVKHSGYLEKGQKIVDDLIEFDQTLLKPERVGATKNVINFGIIDGYIITGRLYRCSIVGSHIVASYRYPLMYLDIAYEKPMLSGSLFQLIYSIDTNKEEKKGIKHNKQYVNHHFNGSWVRHIDCDDEMKDNLENLEKLIEDDVTKLFYTSSSFEKDRNTLSDDQIVELITKLTNSNMDIYKEFLGVTPFNFTSTSKTVKDIIDMCNTDILFKMIKFGLDQRLDQRRKKYGIIEDTEYKVPSIITNLNDLRQELLENGDLIVDEL